MKIKRPSLKGKANLGYLGHFAQDKYIQAGHNDVKEEISPPALKKLREKAAEEGDEGLSGLEKRLKKVQEEDEDDGEEDDSSEEVAQGQDLKKANALIQAALNLKKDEEE